MDREVRELVEELRRQGWEVEERKGGHLRAKSPDGKTLVFLPSTPSDRRWRQNAIRDLKRGGFRPPEKAPKKKAKRPEGEQQP